VPGGSGKKHSSKQRPPKQQGAQVCWWAIACLRMIIPGP
jgi:hypothetical protein